MYKRKNSGNNLQTSQNPENKPQYKTKPIKSNKYGIPKPTKRKLNDTRMNTENNFRVDEKYRIDTSDSQSIGSSVQTEDTGNLTNKGNILSESTPMCRTDRYNKDTVILFERKANNTRNYNNNSVHFIQPNNNEYFQTYDRKLNEYNYTYNTNYNITYNTTNIIKRDNTPKKININNNININIGNQPRKLHYNYSSKTLFNNKMYETEINFPRDNLLNDEVENESYKIFSNSKRNYKIVTIRRTSKNKNDKFNLKTPNNTKTTTIVYTNRNKNKVIPMPKNLFPNTERKNITTGKLVQERNIQKEINEYFYKNRITYSNRNKYINAALFIQTSYRNYKKNGKLKFNYIKKYIKYYKVINNLQAIIKNKKKFWRYFKAKLITYGNKIQGNMNRKISKNVFSNRKKVNDNSKMGQISKMFDKDEKIQNSQNLKTKLRSQSRDFSDINVEELIKEKEDLQKLLDDVMKENNRLKKINLTNKDLLNKNIALTQKLDKTEQKTKQLQIQNEQYLSEFSKTKDKYSKIENEVNDVNKKLKTTYLKFLIEKKQAKLKQILNKYFKRFKENVQRISKLEKKSSVNLNGSNSTFVSSLSSAIKDNTNEYISKKSEDEKKKQEEEELKKEKELLEKIKRRNKILMDLFYNKDKERTRFIHSCFSEFYYKGLINQFKFRKSVILGQLQKNPNTQNNNNNQEEEKKKKEEEEKKRIEEEERKKKEEEEKRKKEEEEKIRKEEEEKKRKEEEERKKQEEQKKEDENKDKMRALNKLNMERRKKLKRLLQEEKNKNLEIKRKYFKKFHFKAFFFASHYFLKKNEDQESNKDDDDDNKNNNEEENEESLAKKLQEEKELKEKKEKEELMNKRIKKLQTIFFKKDRKITIIKKNILQRWNLMAKVISLGPKKKLRGRSKRGNSKKRDVSKKGKKKPDQTNEKKNIKTQNPEDENNNSEDEKEKDKEKEKEIEKEKEKEKENDNNNNN